MRDRREVACRGGERGTQKERGKHIQRRLCGAQSSHRRQQDVSYQTASSYSTETGEIQRRSHCGSMAAWEDGRGEGVGGVGCRQGRWEGMKPGRKKKRWRRKHVEERRFNPKSRPAS